MQLVICGDISISDSSELFKNQDEKQAFNDIVPVFKGADRVIVNLECAVTEHDKGIEKFGPCLKAPFGTIETLKKAGVTDCALSNNHIFDFGKKGLADTIAELEKNGVNYTGIGQNKDDARKDLVITYGDKKISVINVCEHEYSYALYNRVGAREFCPFETMDDIAKAKQNSDFVVVIFHGGKEHCAYPSERLVRACRSMVRRGADLVLCQHTHIISCYEEFEGGHIVYGQGNFHFVEVEYSKTRDYWKKGLMVKADFTDKMTVELIPTVVEGLGIRLANETEKQEIMDGIKERSKTLLDGSYRERFAEFCNDKGQNHYKFPERVLPEDALALFAHYIDCEAHNDVWKELYKTKNHTNELD